MKFGGGGTARHGMARHVIIFHRTRYICSSDRLQHFKRGNHLNIWYRLSGVRVSVRVFRGAAFPESIHETENLHLHRRNLISVLIISFSGRFDREFAISFARTGSPSSTPRRRGHREAIPLQNGSGRAPFRRHQISGFCRVLYGLVTF